MAERFKAVVLKTIIANTITSSNLVLPYRELRYPIGGFYPPIPPKGELGAKDTRPCSVATQFNNEVIYRLFLNLLRKFGTKASFGAACHSTSTKVRDDSNLY